MAAFVSAIAIHPGEFLADELEARGWTQEDLAEITGISRRQIVNLLQKKSGITPDTAMKFSEAFGQEPQIWMHYQVTYELALEAQRDRGIRRKAEIFEWVPVRELTRRGWLPECDDVASLEKSVCGLLRTKAVKEVPDFRVAARKSTTYATETGAQLAWYGRVFERAQGAPASAYSPENIESGLPELMKLAAFPEDARRVPRVLADMGIRLVFVERLRHTKIDGVATWLDEGRKSSPVIGLSLRYDRIDNFWFTLLHELWHIKNNDESPVDVDTLSIQRESDLPDFEITANKGAANRLIPDDKLSRFISSNKPFYYEAKIVQFSLGAKVHPGIVVGQLQNHPTSGFDFKQLRKYLVGVRQFLLGEAITDGWNFKPST